MKSKNFIKNSLSNAIAFTASAAALIALASPAMADTVLRNDRWTITIGNEQSWSGVNGTGNLTYRGCDRSGRCISLRNGKVTCRFGICTTGWRNGEYSYAISSRMSENSQRTGSTLTVTRGSRVIIRSTGLR